MKGSVFIFLAANTCFLPVFGESLLSAQSFPKGFEDMSITSRIDVLREGYAPYEIKYDKNGVCISGCAYKGITIKEDMIAVDEANEEMERLIQEDESREIISPATDWCHNGRSTRLPLRYPVDMTGLKYPITSDFGFRPSSATFHPAIDIGCPIGTPVYATADGIVDNVYNQKGNGGGGLYIDIRHYDTGLITQYLHLNKALVKKGDTVKACQQIAISGNSGKNSSGGSYDAHLDYRVRFDSDKNKYVDILCPCKSSNRNTEISTDTGKQNMTCYHSLFYNRYKFSPYNPDNDNTKRSVWRVKHGHCMVNKTDLLPDEVK